MIHPLAKQIFIEFLSKVAGPAVRNAEPIHSLWFLESLDFQIQGFLYPKLTQQHIYYSISKVMKASSSVDNLEDTQKHIRF